MNCVKACLGWDGEDPQCALAGCTRCLLLSCPRVEWNEQFITQDSSEKLFLHRRLISYCLPRWQSSFWIMLVWLSILIMTIWKCRCSQPLLHFVNVRMQQKCLTTLACKCACDVWFFFFLLFSPALPFPSSSGANPSRLKAFSLRSAAPAG